MTLAERQLWELETARREAWRVPARLNTWQWAEHNLVLSQKTSSNHGPYRTELTPYVRGPLEKWKDPFVRRITLCFGAQTSKTLTELVMLCYAIGEDPGNLIWMMPKIQLAREFSETRLHPLIKDNPELRKHLLPDRHKFQKAHMELDNMVIDLVGANSPTDAASRAARFIICDEADKYPAIAKKESSPIELIWERTKTFVNNKFVMSSTPVFEDGNIWTALNQGNYCRLRVRCPKCGNRKNKERGFFIEWRHVKWDDSIPVEDDSNPHFEKSVRLGCPDCGHAIHDPVRREMVAGGSWTPTNAAAAAGDHWSFHLPEFYSTLPGTGLVHIARKFRRAMKALKSGNRQPLQNVINSSFAEPWKPDELNVKRKPSVILDKRDEWRKPGEVPDMPECPVNGLVSGVDTQANYFKFGIYAFGGGEAMEMFLVREGIAENLEMLARALWGSVYVDGRGRPFNVGVTFMDAMGDRTHEVYEFCRIHRDKWIRPTKGEQRMNGPYQASDLDRFPDTHKPIPGGLKLYRINTTHYKDWLASKLLISLDDPGAFHVHAGIASEEHSYAKQMTAEYRDEDGRWVCPKGRDNHDWDCAVLALAAAEFAGLGHVAPVYEEGVVRVEAEAETYTPPARGKSKFW